MAGIAASGGVSLVGGSWELGGEEVALVLVISCTWSLLTVAGWLGDRVFGEDGNSVLLRLGICWLLWSQPSKELPLQAGGLKEDCSLQDVFFSRLGHDPSISAIVASGAMMVNHHSRLLLRVRNNHFIVTCAESSAWSSGAMPFPTLLACSFWVFPTQYGRLVFVPSTCLGFWDFCLVVMVFCSLDREVISGAAFCVTLDPLPYCL